MIYRKSPSNLGSSIFLMNNKSKVEMLSYKRSLIIKSLASLSNRRGMEGEAYEF